MTTKKTKLMVQFENETGRNSIWKGQITKNFKKWEKQRLKKGKTEKKGRSTPTLKSSKVLSNLTLILDKFQDFEIRLSKLEKTVFRSESKEKVQNVTKKHLMRTIITSYNSLDKRIGDFVSITVLTKKIQEFISWPIDKIHDELYKLFMEYKVDLQPGKDVEGEPLIKDGQTYVWFKLK